MRKTYLSAAAAGFAVCMALMGCLNDKVAGGTGIGNPGNTEFAVVATSTTTALTKTASGSVRNPDSSFTVTDAGGTPFTIRRAYVNIDEVRIRLPDGENCEHVPDTVACANDDIEIPSPFLSDLMTGTSTPDVGTFSTPIGAYRRVEMKLAPLSASAPSPTEALRGHTVFISGDFAYKGKSDRTFTITLDIDEELRIESTDGMTVLDTGVTRLLVQLKVDDWLAHSNITSCLDADSLSLDSAGNLAIDPTHTCANIGQSLSDDVKASCELGDEHHRDGALLEGGGPGPN